jgi:3-hydroxybutyrate dehydrogenase
MDMKKTVVITGAGSGLGRGLCLHLAQLDWRVLALDKNLDAAEQTVAMLPVPAKGQVYEIDVSSPDEVDRFATQMAEQRADVLINNAGCQHVAPLEAFPSEKWASLIAVMLQGTCLMTRSLLPGMREGGFGRIINIGSIHSLVASPYKSAYVAAKHGLIGFSKVVALETADTDITINTICPSYIRTPLVDAQIADQAKAHHLTEAEVVDRIMLEPMPKKVFITVEEVAAAVEFLIGSHARNITGQTIVIDGGWTVR